MQESLQNDRDIPALAADDANEYLGIILQLIIFVPSSNIRKRHAACEHELNYRLFI